MKRIRDKRKAGKINRKGYLTSLVELDLSPSRASQQVKIENVISTHSSVSSSSVQTMVLISDGISEIVKPVVSDLNYLICSRHSVGSRVVTNLTFSLWK